FVIKIPLNSINYGLFFFIYIKKFKNKKNLRKLGGLLKITNPPSLRSPYFIFTLLYFFIIIIKHKNICDTDGPL
ncbi:MAG: hypothetical protein SOX92_00515, partial [Candidatus Onthovivens sp.]|nr:hypothetical protein [Candidatus Onthovivens sp.]